MTPSVNAIVGLSAALLLSLAGNVWQLWNAGVKSGKQTAAADLAVVNGSLQQLRKAQEDSAALAAKSRTDHTALLAELAAIAERGREVRVVYKTIAAAAPLAPNCAPGKARIDAVNAALGAPESRL